MADNSTIVFSYDDYLAYFLKQNKTFFESGKVFEEVYLHEDQDTRLRAANDAAEKKGVPLHVMTKSWEQFKNDRISGKVVPSGAASKAEKEIEQIIGKSSISLIADKTGSSQEGKPISISFDEAQENVKQFDVASFETAGPYDLLVSLNDETSRSRLLHAMRKRAKEVGFSLREFDNLYKARLADQKKQAEREKLEQKEQEIQAVENGTLPKGGIAELFGGVVPDIGEYICSEKGIFRQGVFGLIKVCSHPIFPSKRYVNIETGSELIDISYRIDGQWKTAKLIDRKTISQSKLIASLSEYGMDITSENAKEVVKFLAEMDGLNRKLIPRCEIVNRLGWIPGRGFSPYIDGVSYDSGGKYRDIYSSVHEEGSFDEWKRAAGSIMESKKYIAARVVLAASVASVLLPWTSNQPFIVEHYSSESGTGKTLASKLGVSVWADPSDGRFMRPMNSTMVGFEQTAAFCNNLPMFLDERQSLRESISPESLIYMLCEGSGKLRGTKDGGLREQTQWLNITIVNGEQPLSTSSKSGAINRVISIESQGPVIPGNMSDFADTIHNNYGFAGRKIIERLQHYQDQMQQIKDVYKAFSSDLMRSVTSKQANYGAALLVGDWFLDMIVFDGHYSSNLLNKNDLLPFLATPGMVDINAKIREWLRGFVVSEDQHFIHQGRIPQETDIRTRLFGRKDEDGSILILHQVLKEEVEHRNWDLGSFMRWCDERQLICTKYKPSSRHWDVGATIAGINCRVIHFLPIMFKDDESEQTELDIYE